MSLCFNEKPAQIFTFCIQCLIFEAGKKQIEIDGIPHDKIFF